MSIIALILFLITVGLTALIISVAFKMWRRSSIKEKISELEELDEEYGKVVEAKERFTNTEEKRETITGFKKQ